MKTRTKLPSGWRVYIVQCADGSLYTGVTTDIKRRVREHNGLSPRGARYTRVRRPVVLVYSEKAVDRSSAGKREAAIKKLARPQKLKLITAKKRIAGLQNTIFSL
jgi:putative endonuclease